MAGEPASDAPAAPDVDENDAHREQIRAICPGTIDHDRRYEDVLPLTVERALSEGRTVRVLPEEDRGGEGGGPADPSRHGPTGREG
jgi:hypothetical protein